MTPAIAPGDTVVVTCWWKRGTATTTARVVAVHKDGREIEIDDGGANHRYVAAEAVCEVNGRATGERP